MPNQSHDWSDMIDESMNFLVPSIAFAHLQVAQVRAVTRMQSRSFLDKSG